MMNALLAGLRRLAGRQERPKIPLMICGLGYEHYRIQALVKQSRGHAILALINDFPWNHGTHVEGVRVYYPSEAPSLARRHGIAAILYCHDSDLAIFDADTAAALADLKVAFVRMDPDLKDDFDTFMQRLR